MITIHRYTAPIADILTYQLPIRSKMLSANITHLPIPLGEIEIWAEIDTNYTLETRKLCLRGTGQPFTGEEGAFIATIILNKMFINKERLDNGGRFVGHIFEYDNAFSGIQEASI